MWCIKHSHGGSSLPEDVVDADDAVRPGRSTVVHNGGVALHPHPPAVFGQEPVVLGGHLAFVEHWNKKSQQSLNVSPSCGVTHS